MDVRAHYQEAERLLDLAEAKANEAGSGPVDTRVMDYCMKRAQVHATLAQAAELAALRETPQAEWWKR